MIDANKEKSILQIEREPVLATGRFYGLVKIVKPIESKYKTSLFPEPKQYNDYFLVKRK
ncbi:hypothetical protein [Nostoc sp.]|uniref:hypothetical protein n=1 Tax=Nostoc sp. TaxID=1180 RepID=UPI002FF9F43F